MKYDIVICGSGIAGLWLLNTLTKQGLNVLLIEKNTLGGTQTLASQGMIHGGQKYVLQGQTAVHAFSIAKMPERWKQCFDGSGEIDLREVRSLSQTQIMWPAGRILSGVGLLAAAKLVNAKTRKLEVTEYPEVLKNKKNFTGEVYELPERVLDTKSLISVLAQKERSRIVKGEVTSIDREGTLVVSGLSIQAQLIIFTAGQGNEEILKLLDAPEEASQRRPLRQIMFKSMEFPFYGHGVVNNPKPRVTVTSHPLSEGGYVWYLGGGLAEKSVSLSDSEAIIFAKKEMKEMFPEINWAGKEWATWYGVRAEAGNQDGRLGDGPAIQEYGNVIVAWPTKLTFVPAFSDEILMRIDSKNIEPRNNDIPPELPFPETGVFPWEDARWVK